MTRKRAWLIGCVAPIGLSHVHSDGYQTLLGSMIGAVVEIVMKTVAAVSMQAVGHATVIPRQPTPSLVLRFDSGAVFLSPARRCA